MYKIIKNKMIKNKIIKNKIMIIIYLKDIIQLKYNNIKKMMRKNKNKYYRQ